MNWEFLHEGSFQTLTAILAYIGGASLLIARRRRHLDARYGVRKEAGRILQVIVTIPMFGILAYLAFAHGILASATAFGICCIVSNILAGIKGLFYPFLE